VCAVCSNITYRNPLPVAVAVGPVDDGLLMIRRTIPPVGALALPGGFIDWGERWQTAMAREVREETNIVLDPAAFLEHRVLSSPAGYLLVFGLAPILRGAELPSFVPTNETSERLVISAPPHGMTFPLHLQIVQEFLETRR
jgi:8-oxo-dGTP pyrophosphatase MutT (NUDIX family)